MRVLPIARRAGRAMDTGEDLRISAQWQRPELFPLSRRPLREEEISCWGKHQMELEIVRTTARAA